MRGGIEKIDASPTNIGRTPPMPSTLDAGSSSSRGRTRRRALELLDALVVRWPRWDGRIYGAYAAACVVFAAAAFYGYLLLQTRGYWSAPLDDVFIHFDYARATARGYPFQWSEGNGFSSGNTSLTYPFVLAVGYRLGFQGTTLMAWAAIVGCVSTVVFLRAAGRLLEPLGRAAKYLVPPAVLSLGALDWTLFSGMENAFHLGVWGIVCTMSMRVVSAVREARDPRRAAWFTGLMGAFLCLTRPESAVSVATFGLFAALEVARAERRSSAAFALRKPFGVAVAMGLPAVLALMAQAVANRTFTGEWSANGAIAKLVVNQPYMTTEQKWNEYLFLLKYVVLRNTQHHFSDVLPWGWLVVALAAVPLAVRVTRPVATLLWIQAAGWLVLVALNLQVRWQNERYTMAAVAWILVLAAMGAVCLLRGMGTTLRSRAFWALRAAAAAVAIVGYVVHQAPNMRDQIWFFGRASRNIRDQHIAAGKMLTQMAPARVLVGDAGALTYTSDRPGLDLIGLGGYHDLPFARAGLHGLGASLELIERIPEHDRPDVMAIYPSWWGELPSIFGRRIAEVVVTGNVICGGAEKVLYRADWSPLNRSDEPRSVAPGDTIVDELDVADLVSERAHQYEFPHPDMGFVTFRVLSDPRDPKRELFDAGREIPAGQRETARITLPRDGGRLIARGIRTTSEQSVDVLIDARPVGRLVFPKGTGWTEVALDLPKGLGTQASLALAPVTGVVTSYHLWVVEPGGSSGSRAP